jgi:DNA-binding NarL/FixJ family response regulator
MAKKQPPLQPARVFVFDPEPLVRRGICLLLSRQPELEVCGEAGNPASALAMVREERPTLAIVNLQVGGKTGFGLIRALRASCPSLRILVFSLHREPTCIKGALSAGADAFVTKEEGTDRLLSTVQDLVWKDRQAGVPRTPGAAPGADPASAVPASGSAVLKTPRTSRHRP